MMILGDKAVREGFLEKVRLDLGLKAGDKGTSEGILGRGNGMYKDPDVEWISCIRTCWTKGEAREIGLEGEGEHFLSLCFPV